MIEIDHGVRALMQARSAEERRELKAVLVWLDAARAFIERAEKKAMVDGGLRSGVAFEPKTQTEEELLMALELKP